MYDQITNVVSNLSFGIEISSTITHCLRVKILPDNLDIRVAMQTKVAHDMTRKASVGVDKNVFRGATRWGG